MNDEELLQLLDQKTPDELTLDEIELLRRRVADSPELREKLLHHVEMEQYLTQALARVDVSADTILSKRQKQTVNRGFMAPLLLCLVCVGLVGFIATVIALAVRGPRADQRIAAVETNDDDPETVVDEDVTQPNDHEPVEPSDEPDDAVVPKEHTPAEDVNLPTEPEEPIEPVKPAGPPPIWAAGLDAPATPFAELWHRDFDVRKVAPSKDDMPKWFAKVPGQKTGFDERTLDKMKFGLTSGIAKLQAPWPADGVLRLSTKRDVRFRMHFWVGDAGVTISSVKEETPTQNQWAAYRTQREPGKPTPNEYRLATVDDSRDKMSELKYGPVLLIRWQEGELILSRGDVELVSAQLEAPPEEVYFEGELVYRGLAMERVTDLPSRPNPPPVSLELPQPAKLTWQGELPEGTEQASLDNGGVRLTANQNKTIAWLATELPQTGPRYVEVKLTDVASPTGIYIGGPEKLRENGEVEIPAGKPDGDLLMFARNHRDGQMVAWVKRLDNNQTEAEYGDPKQQVVPYIGSTVWVRILANVASRRYWVSSDGKDWSLLFHHNSWQTTRPMTHLGVYCAPESKEAAITVNDISLRPLPAINSLADEEMLGRAVTVPAATTYAEWLTAVAKAQPEGVETEAWRLACAVKTISLGEHRDVTQSLLDRVLESPAAKAMPLDERIALLNEVSLLHYMYLPLPGGRQFNMPGRYLELIGDSQLAGVTQAYSQVLPALMSQAPLSRLPFKALSPELVRQQILLLAYNEQWEELRTMLSELEFYAQGYALKLVAPQADWATVIAAGQLGESIGGRLTAFDSNWRHPLIEQYSKEGYNVVAELHAALDSESYEDAARIVSALSPETSRGLLPGRRDRQLLRSVKTTIDVGMQDHPQFKAAMNDQFGALAKLRIRKAITAGDAETIRAATVQFHGTQSLSEAYRWLGDRALSAGDFGASLARYRQSLPHAGLLERRETEARMRLAAAMMGQSQGEPVNSAVRFGDVTMTPTEFEALIAEMIQTHSGSHLTITETTPPEADLSFLRKPTAFKVKKLSRFEGDVGDGPTSVPGEVRKLNLPWTSRQIATTFAGDKLYIGNRFHVAAFNTSDGKRLWQSPSPPGGHGHAHHWQNVWMKPLAFGDVVFARMLSKRGPVLACLNRENGQLISKRSYIPPRGEALLSDPFPSQGRLLMLTLREFDARSSNLRLTSVDLTTGQPVSHTEMLSLRKRDASELAATVTPVTDGFLATLGGSVVAFAPDGEVRWVRRQTWLPRDLERTWASQCYDPPLIAGDVALVTQPCVRAIECLKVATGELVWRKPLTQLQTMLGMCDGGLIVQTDDELLAVDPKTGDTRWRRPFRLGLGGQLIAGDRLLITRMHDVDGKNQNFWPQIVWFDTTTGEELASTSLEEFKHQQPRLAPLLIHGEKMWSLLGTSITDPKRELIELTPEGNAERPVIASDDRRWSSLHIHDETLDTLAKKFTQWSILSEAHDQNQPSLIDIHGEEQVMPLVARAGQPVVLARRITVPADGRPHLDLKFGSEPNHNWQFRVSFAGELLREQSYEWAKQQEVFKGQRVDLRPVAGKSGWLVIEAKFVSGGDHTRTYWQQLDIKF